MADISPARGRWAFRPIPPEPRSIVELIGSGTLDLRAGRAALAAHRGSRPDRRRRRGSGRRQVDRSSTRCSTSCRRASASWSWPARTRPSTGSRRRPSSAGPGRRTAAAPTPTRSVRTRRSCWPSSCPTTRPPTPGARRRGSRSGRRRSATGWRRRSTPIRSTRSSTPSAGRRSASTDDELSHLGVVLVLRAARRRPPAGRRRALRPPVARDVHGHLQRLGPAVLATWDPETDAFEHFGWGVTPELARARRPARRATSRSRSTDGGSSSIASSRPASPSRNAARRCDPRIPCRPPTVDAPRGDA